MTARAAVELALARIEALEAELGSLLEVDEDGARARADELDREDSPRGPLHGVPFLVKANLCWRGRVTSAASRALEGYRPPYDATAIARIAEVGAIPLGSCNMDEFGFGSSGEHSSFGATRNPWDLSRSPGGSSSGCAAAVAARFTPFALASDTGGSARQPAALCGVSGFKPSYGRISRHGLIAFASSLDTVGVLADSVERIEQVLAATSGADARDATALSLPPLQPEAPREGLRGLRVGVCAEALALATHAPTRARVEAALDVLRALGAELVPLALPLTRHAVATYQLLSSCEAASNLARYDGLRYGPREPGDGSLQGSIAATRGAGLGAEARRRVLLGTFALSQGEREQWLERAARVRALLRDELVACFEQVDVLAGPTVAGPAFRLGERLDDPLAMYACDALTAPASLAGLPAASVPCGTVEDDGVELPVALQLTGAPLADARVLAVARKFQSATTHHLARPALCGALP